MYRNGKYQGGFNLSDVWHGKVDTTRESTFWDKLDAINIFLMRFNLIWAIILFIITVLVIIIGVFTFSKS